MTHLQSLACEVALRRHAHAFHCIQIGGFGVIWGFSRSQLRETEETSGGVHCIIFNYFSLKSNFLNFQANITPKNLQTPDFNLKRGHDAFPVQISEYRPSKPIAILQRAFRLGWKSAFVHQQYDRGIYSIDGL